MSAEAAKQGTRDTDGIGGDARGQVRRFWWSRLDEAPRLDELARKLRSVHGETTARFQRPDRESGVPPSTAAPSVLASPPPPRCGLRSALERGATWTPRTAGRTRPPAARRAWCERRRERLGVS